MTLRHHLHTNNLEPVGTGSSILDDSDLESFYKIRRNVFQHMNSFEDVLRASLATIPPGVYTPHQRIALLQALSLIQGQISFFKQGIQGSLIDGRVLSSRHRQLCEQINDQFDLKIIKCQKMLITLHQFYDRERRVILEREQTIPGFVSTINYSVASPVTLALTAIVITRLRAIMRRNKIVPEMQQGLGELFALGKELLIEHQFHILRREHLKDSLELRFFGRLDAYVIHRSQRELSATLEEFGTTALPLWGR